MTNGHAHYARGMVQYVDEVFELHSFSRDFAFLCFQASCEPHFRSSDTRVRLQSKVVKYVMHNTRFYLPKVPQVLLAGGRGESMTGSVTASGGPRRD